MIICELYCKLLLDYFSLIQGDVQRADSVLEIRVAAVEDIDRVHPAPLHGDPVTLGLEFGDDDAKGAVVGILFERGEDFLDVHDEAPMKLIGQESSPVDFPDDKSGLFLEKRNDYRTEGAQVFRPALPDDKRSPSQKIQLPLARFVSSNVSFDFLLPIDVICFRSPASSMAIMPMPKATMDEDCFFPAWKHDIRLSGEVLAMEAKSVAKPVN